MLEIRGLSSFYGDFQALYDVSLSVGDGGVLAVIGANGAGKSTLMRAITGLVPSAPGAIRWNGHEISGMRPDQIARLGVAMVPEGRQLFHSLSVGENLLIGGQGGRAGPWSLERVHELFPVLAERGGQPATSLSGGQQQMAAIGRALMSNPGLLLLDEISLGLAPIAVRQVYDVLPKIGAKGMTVIVVEQDLSRALSVADHVCCLSEGRVALSGEPAALTRRQVSEAYFGM